MSIVHPPVLKCYETLINAEEPIQICSVLLMSDLKKSPGV